MIKQKSKKMGLNIEINEEDREIIRILREQYSVNISSLVKNYLRSYLKEIKTMNNLGK